MSEPTKTPGAPSRRLVVVGGVAGGMSAAARARRLDENAEIIVLDRGAHVSFAGCGLPYFVGGEIRDEDALVLHTPESLARSLRLDVRIHHDVVALDTDRRTLTVRHDGAEFELGYDDLVLSPGAIALRPPIPGLDSERVHTLRSVADAVALRRRVTTGARRAVVLGGGFIGLEAAEALADGGLDVTVVELAPHVLPPLETELASLVAAELTAHGTTVREGVGAVAVETTGSGDASPAGASAGGPAAVLLSDGQRIEADVIVLSVGVRPDTAVFEAAGIHTVRGAIVVDAHGRTSADRVWAAGDAVLSRDAVTGAVRPVALGGPANRAGRLVADDIFRPGTARALPALTGTAVVRVHGLTAALTGANRAALDAAGVVYDTIHLHPLQHAGYFPGAAAMHLVVHFATADGRLLGAQGVGPEGVDRRIDVLATAIRAEMSVEDLIDLDLAYAPPYGSAKDAVNFAGMVGENVREGRLALWYAEQLDEVRATSLILDVRRPDELAQGFVPGSLNIPHTEVPARLDEIRRAAAGRPVRVMCQSGVRSYNAHRVLAQAGFESASLSGGWLTLAAAHPSPTAPATTSVAHSAA